MDSYLDNGFNQKMNGCIPNSVVQLIFGNSFSRPTKELMPDSVTQLILKDFNQPIDGHIPDTRLKFWNLFDQDIN